MSGPKGIPPFLSKVPQSEGNNLRDRESRTRRPDELFGVDWNEGIPLGYMQKLAESSSRLLVANITAQAS